MVTSRYFPHSSGMNRETKTMNVQSKDEMLTALRQADAIAAVDGEHSIRKRLGLAHRLYNAMLLLEPGELARRVRLIDAVFTPASRTSEQKRREL
jgi:hypothetical protein